MGVGEGGGDRIHTMHINVSKQKLGEKSKDLFAFMYHGSVSRLFNLFPISDPYHYVLKILENYRFAGGIEKSLLHDID